MTSSNICELLFMVPSSRPIFSKFGHVHNVHPIATARSGEMVIVLATKTYKKRGGIVEDNFVLTARGEAGWIGDLSFLN